MDPSQALERTLRAAGFRGAIRLEEPLAPYTTWRIGGPAEAVAQPADLLDLRTAVAVASSGGIRWRVLGNGSNVLVRDEGLRGLVIRLRKVLDELRFDGPVVRAGAGASLPALAREAADRGLSGLEFGAGIPGTVGGAVIMNAGWHEHEFGAVVSSVGFLDAGGAVEVVPAGACRFGYRASAFRGLPGVVLHAELDLRPDEPRAIRERMDRFLASRKATQPTDLPSCGSVFLKPPGDFAGRLIEAAGLKGARVGDVQVSPKHANFFVNLGRGTSADALALVEHVEETVHSRFGVRLVREFEIW